MASLWLSKLFRMSSATAGLGVAFAIKARRAGRKSAMSSDVNPSGRDVSAQLVSAKCCIKGTLASEAGD